MDRKTYEWSKRTSRDAYEYAIRGAVGGGEQPITDEHTHNEYLTDSGNQELTQTWKLKSNNKTFMTISDDETHIYHVADPDAASHVANRNYVDTAKEVLEDRINALEHELEDLTELDDRYSQKGHTHNYASSSHTHNYASSNHTHSTIFRSGTTTNPSLSKGEPFLNTSQKVVYVGL